jgi:acetyl-CoA acyltransferase
MPEAVIVSGARTAIGKAPRGTLRNTRPDELAAAAVAEVVRRTPGLKPEEIDDVIIGTALPEREQGFNLGRIVAMRAGLPHTVPAFTVNRFCSTGLQTIAQAAESIIAGSMDVVIAGGVESMSLVPFDASLRSVPNPHLADTMCDLYLGMGLTAENIVDKYNITREDADEYAYNSHMKAIAAIENGHFKDEIFPVTLSGNIADGKGGVVEQNGVFEVDEGPRKDTSIERLAKLRAVFKLGGTVTAGNSSQTSDGAAVAMLMSREKADALGLKPQAIFRGFSVAGVPPEIMGIGPIAAIPKLLKRTGTSMNDIDLIELNEAFACQALAVMRELDLPQDKVNVNGGAVALGHPLGCTGAKLTLTLIHELKRRGGGLGLVTMCIGGGMGAAGLFEVPGE